ncbi:MAG: hypothetical protein IKM33_00760 [Clostridia bacterium]|nr:hypothetical protein [Clostridia bacterium]
MTESCRSSPSPRHFAVIGGDLRMTHLCKRLTEAGYTVSALGCGLDCLPDAESRSAPEGEGALRICSSLKGATDGAEALILPLPASKDGVTVHCPRDPTCTVALREIAELMARTPRLLLFGGRLPKEFMDTAEKSGVAKDRISDYYDSEVLQLRNAYLTAEAALMTAMELTDCAIRGVSVGVLGYGRIGKFLSRLLHGLGAEVTVCARREESLFEAAAQGCHPLLMTESASMGGLSPLCRGHSVLFNTIPARVLPRDLLMGLEKNTLLIDLASAPFGVSDRDVREATAEIGLRYLRAPSLPGSYAPRDAGRIVAECILEELSRRDTLSESSQNAYENGGNNS